MAALLRQVRKSLMPSQQNSAEGSEMSSQKAPANARRSAPGGFLQAVNRQAQHRATVSFSQSSKRASVAPSARKSLMFRDETFQRIINGRARALWHEYREDFSGRPTAYMVFSIFRRAVRWGTMTRQIVTTWQETVQKRKEMKASLSHVLNDVMLQLHNTDEEEDEDEDEDWDEDYVAQDSPASPRSTGGSDIEIDAFNEGKRKRKRKKGKEKDRQDPPEISSYLSRQRNTVAFLCEHIQGSSDSEEAQTVAHQMKTQLASLEETFAVAEAKLSKIRQEAASMDTEEAERLMQEAQEECDKIRSEAAKLRVLVFEAGVPTDALGGFDPSSNVLQAISETREWLVRTKERTAQLASLEETFAVAEAKLSKIREEAASMDPKEAERLMQEAQEECDKIRSETKKLRVQLDLPVPASSEGSHPNSRCSRNQSRGGESQRSGNKSTASQADPLSPRSSVSCRERTGTPAGASPKAQHVHRARQLWARARGQFKNGAVVSSRARDFKWSNFPDASKLRGPAFRSHSAVQSMPHLSSDSPASPFVRQAGPDVDPLSNKPRRLSDTKVYDRAWTGPLAGTDSIHAISCPNIDGEIHKKRPSFLPPKQGIKHPGEPNSEPNSARRSRILASDFVSSEPNSARRSRILASDFVSHESQGSRKRTSIAQAEDGASDPSNSDAEVDNDQEGEGTPLERFTKRLSKATKRHSTGGVNDMKKRNSRSKQRHSTGGVDFGCVDFGSDDENTNRSSSGKKRQNVGGGISRQDTGCGDDSVYPEEEPPPPPLETRETGTQGFIPKPAKKLCPCQQGLGEFGLCVFCGRNRRAEASEIESSRTRFGGRFLGNALTLARAALEAHHRPGTREGRGHCATQTVKAAPPEGFMVPLPTVDEDTPSVLEVMSTRKPRNLFRILERLEEESDPWAISQGNAAHTWPRQHGISLRARDSMQVQGVVPDGLLL